MLQFAPGGRGTWLLNPLRAQKLLTNSTVNRNTISLVN